MMILNLPKNIRGMPKCHDMSLVLRVNGTTHVFWIFASSSTNVSKAENMVTVHNSERPSFRRVWDRVKGDVWIYLRLGLDVRYSSFSERRTFILE